MAVQAVVAQAGAGPTSEWPQNRVDSGVKSRTFRSHWAGDAEGSDRVGQIARAEQTQRRWQNLKGRGLTLWQNICRRNWMLWQQLSPWLLRSHWLMRIFCWAAGCSILPTGQTNGGARTGSGPGNPRHRRSLTSGSLTVASVSFAELAGEPLHPWSSHNNSSLSSHSSLGGLQNKHVKKIWTDIA